MESELQASWESIQSKNSKTADEDRNQQTQSKEAALAFGKETEVSSERAEVKIAEGSNCYLSGGVL